MHTFSLIRNNDWIDWHYMLDISHFPIETSPTDNYPIHQHYTYTMHILLDGHCAYILLLRSAETLFGEKQRQSRKNSKCNLGYVAPPPPRNAATSSQTLYGRSKLCRMSAIILAILYTYWMWFGIQAAAGAHLKLWKGLTTILCQTGTYLKYAPQDHVACLKPLITQMLCA